MNFWQWLGTFGWYEWAGIGALACGLIAFNVFMPPMQPPRRPLDEDAVRRVMREELERAAERRSSP